MTVETASRFRVVDDPQEITAALAVMRDSDPEHFRQVGNWFWARHTTKPPEETRKALLAAGWRWSRSKLWEGLKGAWYLPTCPVARDRRRPSVDALEERHGSFDIDIDDARPATAGATAQSLFS